MDPKKYAASTSSGKVVSHMPPSVEPSRSVVEWGATDFTINKEFWRHWGHAAALPFRVQNLESIQTIFWRHGIPSSLFGTTLKNALDHGLLLEDHDDDIFAFASFKDIAAALSDLNDAGFTMIRSSPSCCSFERHLRYIDVHFAAGITLDLRWLRVNGTLMKVVTENHLLDECRNKHKIPEVVGISRITSEELITSMKAFLKRARKVPRYLHRRLNAVVDSRFRTIRLSQQDFLSLKIDAEDAMNWSWRGTHWRQVFEPGEILGDALERFSNFGPPIGDSQQFSEPLIEPLHLSRQFWKIGSDNLAAHVRYGFRHLVVPYHAANLYIHSEQLPVLYSDAYFCSLTPMTQDEIEKVMKLNPLEVRRAAFSSGRHRAAAMVGHLLSGGTYAPVYAKTSIARSLLWKLFRTTRVL